MTLLQNPFFCASASGTFRPGITIRARHGHSHLIRQATSHKPRTQVQRSLAMYVGAITKYWMSYSYNKTYIHYKHPKFAWDDVYRAWLKYQHSRRTEDLWPDYSWADPPWQPQLTIGDPTVHVKARALTFQETKTNASYHFTLACRYSGIYLPGFTPHDVTHWFFRHNANTPYVLIDRLPAQPLFISYVLVDLWGRASAPNISGPYTPAP